MAACYGGAEAVFRALAHNPHEDWLLDWYEHSPVFAQTTEWGYRVVARHRSLFSALTRLAWGRHLDPPTHNLVRWVFLRSLGLIYLVAFVSLWVQIMGLVGSHGILPANSAMAAMRLQADAQRLGLDRYHLVPTLCWFSASDGFLKFQCAAGATLAVLLIIGLAPAPCLFLLWLIYLSLATVCREFLSFQWDNLLLETGFLAIFLAPLQLLAPVVPRRAAFAPCALAAALAVVQADVPVRLRQTAQRRPGLAQPDGAYLPLRDSTAADVDRVVCAPVAGVGAKGLRRQRCSALSCSCPFLIFAPRRPRQFACVVLVVFQALIFLTGNYCFFNLLTVALCLLLLDDAALKALLPGQAVRSSFTGRASVLASPTTPSQWASRGCPPSRLEVAGANHRPACGHRHRHLAPAILSACSASPFPGRGRLLAVYAWLEPFRSFNSYGLFAVMTTSRPEIIIEGSDDGVTWRAYEFKYKPGDVKRRPGFVEPHQPRLDWQMWFAALGTYRQNPWLVNFCVRLLQGSPPVLALLERNPFPNAPPRYIRAVVYDYRFTDFATRRKTGAWWRRQEEGEYLPAFSLGDAQ